MQDFRVTTKKVLVEIVAVEKKKKKITPKDLAAILKIATSFYITIYFPSCS